VDVVDAVCELEGELRGVDVLVCEVGRIDV
jgi:hypothetical protein